MMELINIIVEWNPLDYRIYGKTPDDLHEAIGEYDPSRFKIKNETLESKVTQLEQERDELKEKLLNPHPEPKDSTKGHSTFKGV